MKQQILLGYEVKTGKDVYLPLHHTALFGMTGKVGKTTAADAIVSRSELPAVAFQTARGEKGFTGAWNIPAFYRPRSDWQFIEGLLGSALGGEKLKYERGMRWAIQQVSKNTKTLFEVYDNCVAARDSHTLQGRKLHPVIQQVIETLIAYFDLVLPDLKTYTFSRTLELRKGVNLMDLSEMRVEMQQIIIASTIQEAYEKFTGIIVIVPEAWEMLPNGRRTPVTVTAEEFIRKAAKLGSYMLIDTQDIGGVDKTPLRQCDNWLMGRMKEAHEISRLAKQMLGKKVPSEEIQKLPVGHFFASIGDRFVKVYVQPQWMPADVARQVALGKRDPPEMEEFQKEQKELVKITRVQVPMHPQEQSIGFKELTQEIEGLKENLTMFGGQMRDMERSMLRATHQTIEAFKEDYDAKLRALALHPPIAEVIATYPSGGSIEYVEEEWHISHSKKELHYTTENILGQIMFAIVNDLEGKPSSISQIGGAMREYSWAPHEKSLRINLANLVKKGDLVKEGSTRDAVYRTPKKVKVTVDKK